MFWGEVFTPFSSSAFYAAAETQCVVSSKNSSTCTATLGATVYIQMMNNASSHQVKFKKQSQLTKARSVFTLRKDNVTIQEIYKGRVEVFIGNGTMKIMRVERNDSGQYSIEIFRPDGMLLKNSQLTLDVQGKYLKFISCNACTLLHNCKIVL